MIFIKNIKIHFYLSIIKHSQIALRNIFKDKMYSLINLVGLSVAIACCFLLIFWIKFELSYEDSHPKADRTFKVLQMEKRTDGFHYTESIRPGIAEQFKNTFPEIEASTLVSHEQLSFTYEDGEGIMVDYTTATPDYLDMFSYEYVEGSKENVLNSKGAIMSEEVARKFFGKESAIGKTVTFSNFLSCNIQAVVKIPKNTHLKFGLLDLSILTNYGGVHYILLKENARFTEEKQWLMADFLSTTRKTENKLSFLPVKNIHLHSPKELSKNTVWQTFGDLKQIYLFSIIALMILSIAIINYVNTSTARAMSRMREVSIRKITGSSQWQLILRFLSDAFILSAASVVVALVLSKWLFPEFSMLMGNAMSYLFDLNTILIALVVCVVITILSGGYAAFYLSSFNPITAIRGGVRASAKENLRKTLIGFQFFLSVGLLISTIIIYKQTHYMFTADTGIDRKNIIILDTSLWYDVENYIQVIKKENPNIIDASIANVAPYKAEYGYSGISWEGSQEAITQMEFTQIFCDHNYANTFGLQLIDGEFIQPGWGWWQYSDSTSFSIVINETFKNLMGVENPIGLTVNYPGKGKIIGVVRDFNFKPLKEPITPLIMCFNPEASTKLYIKTTGANYKETMAYIQRKYMEMRPSYHTQPFMCSTVEDDYNVMYKSEMKTMKMLTIFSGLSLCLCVMGIFSMVSLMVEKSKKEIAIRRINGAETRNIISLFIFHFTKIIGVSCAMAISVSFAIMLRWLQAYAFRTSLSWWIFILVPLIVSVITATLIAVQVFLTSRQNPAEVMKKD